MLYISVLCIHSELCIHISEFFFPSNSLNRVHWHWVSQYDRQDWQKLYWLKIKPLFIAKQLSIQKLKREGGGVGMGENNSKSSATAGWIHFAFWIQSTSTGLCFHCSRKENLDPVHCHYFMGYYYRCESICPLFLPDPSEAISLRISCHASNDLPKCKGFPVLVVLHLWLLNWQTLLK